MSIVDYVNPVQTADGFGDPNNVTGTIEGTIAMPITTEAPALTLVASNASIDKPATKFPFWLVALTVFAIFALSKDRS